MPPGRSWPALGHWGRTRRTGIGCGSGAHDGHEAVAAWAGPVPSAAMFHDTASSPFPNANRTLGGTGSGATDFASGHPAVDHELAEHIPQKARTAVQGWLDSVLQAELQHAPREKPSVPQDVDRSLLQDRPPRAGTPITCAAPAHGRGHRAAGGRRPVRSPVLPWATTEGARPVDGRPQRIRP